MVSKDLSTFLKGAQVLDVRNAKLRSWIEKSEPANETQESSSEVGRNNLIKISIKVTILGKVSDIQDIYKAGSHYNGKHNYDVN